MVPAILLVTSGAVLALGCGPRPRSRTTHAVVSSHDATPQSAPEPAPVKVGELITYQRGTEIGREVYVDDGDRLESTLHYSGKTTRYVVRRSPSTVHFDVDGTPASFDLDTTTVAIETGSWAVFRLIADRFAGSVAPTRISVLLPSEGLMLEGVVSVTVLANAAREIKLTTNGLETRVRLDPDGTVEHAEIPEQGIEVTRAGALAPHVETRPAPSEVVESLVEITSGGVILRGSIWTPTQHKDRVPVVLMLAGSGPTDRDGNNHSGLKTDMYRMLATELAKRGVATCRFDKRGVGASGRGFDASSMVVDDLVNDAAQWVAHLRTKNSFSAITVLGHSEGGEIALLLARQTAIDGLILVATAGRTHREILREQLSLRVDAKVLETYDDIVERIARGERVREIPGELVSVLRPSVQIFVRSDLDLDPLPLARGLSVPVSIIQGDADVQVRLRDARRLKSARPDAKLTIVSGMNHVLKQEFAVWLAQNSYMDETRPLATGLVDAVLAGVVGR